MPNHARYSKTWDYESLLGFVVYNKPCKMETFKRAKRKAMKGKIVSSEALRF